MDTLLLVFWHKVQGFVLDSDLPRLERAEDHHRGQWL